MGWRPMAVQAAGWALLGALFAGVAVAADGPATQPASDSLAAASFPVATDARLGGDESQTRFVMDLDRKIDLHVFTLADPSSSIFPKSGFSFRRKPEKSVEV
jgi:N-acetylmuramoyl-L-alanine amidase